jgi:hypothetical protein
MKPFIYISSLAVVAVSFMLTACKKEETPTATITFNEPFVNDTILAGDSVHIEGTISGSGELHGYTLSITNKTSGSTIYTGSTSNHSNAYVFHEHWLNNVTFPSNIEVKVEIELNHEGDKVSKSIQVLALN